MNWQEMPNAPGIGTRLANLNDLVDGGVQEVVFGEGKDAFKIMLMREGEQVQAFLNRCPHYGVPLNPEGNKFYILPERQVMCVIHCSVFRMTDGHCVDGPVKGDTLIKITIDVDEDGEATIADR